MFCHCSKINVTVALKGKTKEVSPTNVPNHLRKLKAKPVLKDLVRFFSFNYEKKMSSSFFIIISQLIFIYFPVIANKGFLWKDS